LHLIPFILCFGQIDIADGRKGDRNDRGRGGRGGGMNRGGTNGNLNYYYLNFINEYFEGDEIGYEDPSISERLNYELDFYFCH